jgi:hypothetical protein
MEINYWAVLACAVLAMVVGYVWYGLIFKKMWMGVIGATELDEITRREMERKAMPLSAIQFLLVAFQVYVLAHYIQGWADASGIENALWIWAAFVVPTVAAGSMWNNDSAKVAWTRFLLQSGYFLVLFAAFGLILGYWQ